VAPRERAVLLLSQAGHPRQPTGLAVRSRRPVALEQELVRVVLLRPLAALLAPELPVTVVLSRIRVARRVPRTALAELSRTLVERAREQVPVVLSHRSAESVARLALVARSESQAGLAGPVREPVVPLLSRAALDRPAMPLAARRA